MEIYEISKKELNLSDYIKRSALPVDFKKLIKKDCLVVENGAPKILYATLPKDITEKLRQSCKNIKYEKGTRTTGLKSESKIFGYNPRNVIRKDFCSATSLAYESPEANKTICDFGFVLAELYKKYFPEIYAAHSNIVEKRILKEWQIDGTPFTSGIVNKNNPLKYHFDAGNIKNVLSNMVVFKHHIEGGFLSCPEYEIGFEVADNTVILFDGQKILHGVTPIKKLSESAYRYSIVYYTLQQMWNCLTITDEIARAQTVRTKRENNRADGITSLDKLT